MLFDEHGQQQPQPASDRIFDTNEGFGFEGAVEHPDARAIYLICTGDLFSLEWAQALKTEERIWPAQWTCSMVARQRLLSGPRAGTTGQSQMVPIHGGAGIVLEQEVDVGCLSQVQKPL